MHRLALALAGVTIASTSAPAQGPVFTSAGIGHVRAEAVIATTAPSLTWQAPASKGGGHGVWLWVGVGALVGAAAGGTWVAVKVAHTEDAFFPGLAIGVGIAGGAVAGGIAGALAYEVLRAGPALRGRGSASGAPNGR